MPPNPAAPFSDNLTWWKCGLNQWWASMWVGSTWFELFSRLDWKQAISLLRLFEEKKHFVSLGNFYKLRVKCHAFTWKLQRKRPWHMILICLINVLKVVTSVLFVSTDCKLNIFENLSTAPDVCSSFATNLQTINMSQMFRKLCALRAFSCFGS